MANININSGKIYRISSRFAVTPIVSIKHNINSEDFYNESISIKFKTQSNYFNLPVIENVINIKKYKDVYNFVEDNTDPISLQTNHTKLLKFLASLKNLDKNVESKRTTAQMELDSYNLDFYKNDFEKWTDDSDLTEIKNGERRFVDNTATGFFSNVKNQFAIYIGPTKK